MILRVLFSPEVHLFNFPWLGGVAAFPVKSMVNFGPMLHIDLSTFEYLSVSNKIESRCDHCAQNHCREPSHREL
jgi:hypothetical protein